MKTNDSAFPISYMQDIASGEMIQYPESGLTKREFAAIHILGCMGISPDYMKGPCNKAAVERAVILTDMLFSELNIQNMILVPYEPTKEMLSAAKDCTPKTEISPNQETTARSIYVCMLAASHADDTADLQQKIKILEEDIRQRQEKLSKLLGITAADIEETRPPKSA